MYMRSLQCSLRARKFPCPSYTAEIKASSKRIRVLLFVHVAKIEALSPYVSQRALCSNGRCERTV